MKSIIRKLLRLLHLDITLNLKYDRLTEKIIAKVLTSQSSAIDVGAHKGEVLDLMLKYAPNAKHYAIEALPHLAKALKEKYQNVVVFQHALSNKQGKVNFNFVKNAPAYSGLKEREYAVANPDIEQIEVEMTLLDNLIPEKTTISLIKIDVEGAEYQVLKGASRILKESKPVVIFEFGLGASDRYETSPIMIFNFFDEHQYGIYSLDAFLSNRKKLTLADLTSLYESKKECYFVAKHQV